MASRLPSRHQTLTHIPLAYTLFFLHIEPISALVGAYFAYYQSSHYLYLTHAPSAPSTPTPPKGTTIALAQLANLYLLFALNEALVLRASRERAVWRTLLFGLLVADLGHLWSVSGLGWRVYVEWWDWNEMMWGNIGFVYAGAAMRMAFLMGVGLD